MGIEVITARVEGGGGYTLDRAGGIDFVEKVEPYPTVCAQDDVRRVVEPRWNPVFRKQLC